VAAASQRGCARSARQSASAFRDGTGTGIGIGIGIGFACDSQLKQRGSPDHLRLAALLTSATPATNSG
jgi:hypothetical protein